MEEVSQTQSPTPAPNRSGDKGSIQFYSGDFLTEETARPVTKRSVTRVIVIAGEPESGKTTMLASLNDAFQKGPFGGATFAGSLTLLAFERICHDARITSNRAVPVTQRTQPTSDIRFLHLTVLDRLTKDPRLTELLLTDISGERLRLLRDSTEEATKMTVFTRADQIAFLFDGADLARPETRHAARTNTLTLIRSALDSGIIGKHSAVQIVFSKWDLVKSAADSATTQEFVSQIKRDVVDRFEPRVGRLTFCEMAARPSAHSGLPFAYGLDTLFQSWLSDSPAATPPPEDTIAASRAFSRYRAPAHSGAQVP